MDKTDRDVAKQVVAVALKQFVWADVQDDIKVARAAAAIAGFAVAGGAQARAGVHSGGDPQGDLGGTFHATGAVAGFARPLDHPAGALAMGTGLGDAENAAGTNDLAAAAAGGTGPDLRPLFRAVAFAGLALVGFGERHLLFATPGGFLESQFHVIAQIRALLGLTRIGATAAKNILEHAPAAKDFAEDVKWVMETRPRPAAAPTRPPVKGRVAELVIRGPLLLVIEHLVSLAQFLEFLLRSLVARVLIGVIFHRLLAVGLLDFLGAGGALNAQDLVIVAFGHGSGGGVFGNDDGGGTQEPLPQTIAFAQLLHHLAFGRFGGFPLRHRLVQIGVEPCAGGVHLLEPKLAQRRLQLLTDQIDAGLHGLQGLARGGLGSGGQRHVEAVQHGDELLQQPLVGELGGLLLLARGALLVVVKIRQGAQ